MTHIRVKKDKKNMNQNQVKLIAIDMDGTLLNSQKEIPEENIKAIQEATAAGIKIVLCTGRPRSGIVPHFEKLGLSEEEYIIMNNGCSTYETKNWTLLESESLSRSEMEELLQACEDFPGVALTFTGEKSYYVVGNEVPELVAYDAGNVFTEAKARSLEEIFEERQVIFQAMYMAESEPTKTLYKIYLIRAIAQFVVKNIFLKSCHRGQLRLAGLNI